MSDLEGFYMDMEDGVDRFPFIEDENGNITGYGHQDKATFAAEINRYDEYCNGGPIQNYEQWEESYISHQWVVVDASVELLISAFPEDTGAFPVTTLWGAR